MKRSFEVLPEGYEKDFGIDLMKDKKLAVLVNLLAVVIGIAMILPAHLIVPIGMLFDFSQGMGMYALRFGVLIVSMILYVVLHEFVHGLTMKYFGVKKVHYGFHGLYASAGCDEYLDKKSYLAVALAPVVVWGIVFLILQFFVDESWFWVVWLLQVINISGAAGDFYVTFKFARLSKDILVRDHGVGMEVFSRRSA